MFIEIRAIPRFDSNNNLIGLIHVVRDISERKRIEDQIKHLLNDVTKAKIEWETTFDNAMEFIMLVEKELKIIRCNKSYANFVGKPIQELLGHRCHEFFPCGSLQAEYCKDKIEKEEQTEWMEVKTKSGQWFYVSHRPVFDEKGEFMYSIIIETDITIIKDTQENLIKSEEELKKRVEELEKFYDMAVGREIRMRELKEKTKKLEAELSWYKKDEDTG